MGSSCVRSHRRDATGMTRLSEAEGSVSRKSSLHLILNRLRTTQFFVRIETPAAPMLLALTITVTAVIPLRTLPPLAGLCVPQWARFRLKICVPSHMPVCNTSLQRLVESSKCFFHSAPQLLQCKFKATSSFAPSCAKPHHQVILCT